VAGEHRGRVRRGSVKGCMPATRLLEKGPEREVDAAESHVTNDDDGNGAVPRTWPDSRADSSSSSPTGAQRLRLLRLCANRLQAPLLADGLRSSGCPSAHIVLGAPVTSRSATRHP
jgi:hypothetical protein